MKQKFHYSLKQARNELPRIVSEAHTGAIGVVTKNGQPLAAVVPLQVLDRLQQQRNSQRGLRGTGKGLWGTPVDRTVATLRDEWNACSGR